MQPLVCHAGYEGTDKSKLLIQERRLELALEFMSALQAPERSQSGVLLSGPNGVGKSAVGLLAFLAAFAQRLPVVYIPWSAEWVTAAKSSEAAADKYFLEAFVAQNAGAYRFEWRACDASRADATPSHDCLGPLMPRALPCICYLLWSRPDRGQPCAS